MGNLSAVIREWNVFRVIRMSSISSINFNSPCLRAQVFRISPSLPHACQYGLPGQPHPMHEHLAQDVFAASDPVSPSKPTSPCHRPGTLPSLSLRWSILLLTQVLLQMVCNSLMALAPSCFMCKLFQLLPFCWTTGSLNIWNKKTE